MTRRQHKVLTSGSLIAMPVRKFVSINTSTKCKTVNWLFKLIDYFHKIEVEDVSGKAKNAIRGNENIF